jgi:polyisoprenoid-binding protein YceI
MKPSAKLLCLVASLSAATLAFAADPFLVDAVHSSVHFRVKHMNTSYAWGRFNEVSGKFLVDEADPAKSVFDLTINAESIDTANSKRDAHLKNPDFFNTKQFPRITFKSKSVKKVGAEYEVSGDMNLHGVTKPVTFHLTVTGSGKGMQGEALAGVEATAVIKRSDFGMNYMVGPIGDEVTVTAAFEGSRK